MSFNDGPGFTSNPGMYYPLFRFGLSGGEGETAWSSYFIVCNYPGSPAVTDNDLLGSIKDAVAALPNVTSVQVVKYDQVTQDVTSSI